MKERPILFSAPMIRAILAGTKSQTRRIVNPQPPSVEEVLSIAGDGYHLSDAGAKGMWRVMGPVWAVRKLMAGDPVKARARADVGPQWRCPYGVPGDRLWCKESISLHGERQGEGRDVATYDADGSATPLDTWPWKRDSLPGMFMPRGLSRITLEIVEVRVERLHEITEEDARAEGIAFDGRWFLGAEHPIKETPKVYPTARQAYTSLWESINGASPWAANPWVWVVGFRRVESGR